MKTANTDYEQIMCRPILSDPEARAFFEKHGAFRVNCPDFWQMYQKSQM